VLNEKWKIHSHFDQIPATLTGITHDVPACNTDISSGGLHGAARSLLNRGGGQFGAKLLPLARLAGRLMFL